ncbi:putative pterin-4-alpha-carbinolamine dehydratase [Deinococcus carri]|uniref:4a-hydroxytetrahydrobiopterin dehydratase n=2 Tax=Deinococcus carri TaxID=1211323 RepID=A0ABP9WD51_9DEIO
MTGMCPELYDPRLGYDPARKLTDGDVQDLKPEGWWGDDGKLFREFHFDSYPACVDFAVRVAALAEARGHHPDLHIYFRKVRVNYFTHDAGGVTALDLENARAVSALWDEVSGAREAGA